LRFRKLLFPTGSIKDYFEMLLKLKVFFKEICDLGNYNSQLVQAMII